MRLLIIVSFAVALMMSVFPIHVDWRWLRPEFVALMVIYWSLYAPEHVGVFTAWCLGLLQDILEFGLLGQNALGFAIIAYICHLFYRRILRYTLWQQAGCVFLLIIFYLSFNNWIDGMFAHEKVKTPLRLWSAPISVFMWPLIVFLGEHFANRPTLYKNRN